MNLAHHLLLNILRFCPLTIFIFLEEKNSCFFPYKYAKPNPPVGNPEVGNPDIYRPPPLLWDIPKGLARLLNMKDGQSPVLMSQWNDQFLRSLSGQNVHQFIWWHSAAKQQARCTFLVGQPTATKLSQSMYFISLATLVALHYTPVSEWTSALQWVSGQSFEIA